MKTENEFLLFSRGLFFQKCLFFVLLVIFVMPSTSYISMITLMPGYLTIFCADIQTDDTNYICRKTPDNNRSGVLKIHQHPLYWSVYFFIKYENPSCRINPAILPVVFDTSCFRRRFLLSSLLSNLLISRLLLLLLLLFNISPPSILSILSLVPLSLSI